MRRESALLVMAVALLFPGAVDAADSCNATITSSYRGQDTTGDSEFVDHVFAIEVESDIECAKIDYVLTVVEKPKDGPIVTKTKNYNQRFRSGESKARKVKYRLARSTGVEDYGFEVTGCKPCAAP